jgi:uncharacterized protein YodC (DUF2158 family)
MLELSRKYEKQELMRNRALAEWTIEYYMPKEIIVLNPQTNEYETKTLNSFRDAPELFTRRKIRAKNAKCKFILNFVACSFYISVDENKNLSTDDDLIIEYDNINGDPEILLRDELTNLKDGMYTCSWQKKSTLYKYVESKKVFEPVEMLPNSRGAFYTNNNLVFVFNKNPIDSSTYSKIDYAHEYLFNDDNLYNIGGYVWETYNLKSISEKDRDETSFDAQCRNQKFNLVPNIYVYSTSSKVWCLNGKVVNSPPCEKDLQMTISDEIKNWSMCDGMYPLKPRYLFENSSSDVLVKGNKKYINYMGFNGQSFNNSLFKSLA